MKAQRSVIAMRSERVEQLKKMAALHDIPATVLLEELVRKQARRDEIPLPGLIIGKAENDSGVILFGFYATNDEQPIPLTSLTKEEATRLSKCFRACTAKPYQKPDSVEVTREKTTFEVGKKSVAIVMLMTRGKKKYKKTLSTSMAIDVADWLEAAAKAVKE